MESHKNTCLILSLIVLSVLFFSTKVYSQAWDNPKVEKVAEGFIFIEGPVWSDSLGLLFSDIPGDKIYQFGIDSTVSVYQSPSGNSNGLAFDEAGNLVLCQHGLRQVSRMEKNGEFAPLATHYKGKRLNSPNDLDIAADGSVFFTDPPYGLDDKAKSELGFCGIYRLMPSGKLYLLDSTVKTPNGIALSADEKKLYAGDSEERLLFCWDIVNDSVLAHKTQFAYMDAKGYTDGMKTDKNGFLYSTGPGGIWIYSPQGEFLQLVEVPGQNTNCAWGGADRKTLYVTSGNTLYRIIEK
ncbi:MAG: SMP-30/gluconolactonase/LRE family protein [Bacteroidales bacterium]|nr:SMP-30/gluconolactonase/LRE family protein [Bacteroidales bacterium]